MGSQEKSGTVSGGIGNKGESVYVQVLERGQIFQWRTDVFTNAISSYNNARVVWSGVWDPISKMSSIVAEVDKGMDDSDEVSPRDDLIGS